MGMLLGHVFQLPHSLHLFKITSNSATKISATQLKSLAVKLTKVIGSLQIKRRQLYLIGFVFFTSSMDKPYPIFLSRSIRIGDSTRLRHNICFYLLKLA